MDFICAYIFLLVICQMYCLAKTSTDSSALVHFKTNIVSDPHHILAENWSNSSSVCRWIGVTCGARHHRVISLNISNMNLSGTISPQLGNLSFLVSLDLGNNHFDGNIPQELGRLHKLRWLRMQGNRLSGVIPPSIFNISTLKVIVLQENELSGNLPSELCENLPFLPSYLYQCSNLRYLFLSPAAIGELTNLQILQLGSNKLNGTIPQDVGKLQNLVELFLERNQISGGLPRNILNISSLQILNLHHNQLVGNLPRDIRNLTKLRILNLAYNNLTGTLPEQFSLLLEGLLLDFNKLSGIIPPQLFNISTLRSLSLTLNALSGVLPTNMCGASSLLEEIHIGGNQLTGVVPDSLSNCSRLKIFDIGLNNFSAFQPRVFSNLRYLEVLQLFGNNLRIESSSLITTLTNCRYLTRLAIGDNPACGILPPSVGNLSSSFKELFAYRCNLKGSIPPQIGNLSNLMTLSLFDNELSGNIPPTIKYLHKLQALAVTSNSVKGPIPEGLCGLSSMVSLKLGQNQLSGAIPECLGTLTSLRELFLDSNNLSSNIPSTLWGLKDLLRLDLSSNYLSGSLPPEIQNLKVAIYLNLSNNQLSGSIPGTIVNLQNLVALSLSQNQLEGSIPESMGRMISLVYLDLSHNNFSGVIPKSLEDLQYLKYLDISFNILHGEIPNGGPFINFTMESFRNNKALCGAPKFSVPSCPTVSVSLHRSKMKKVKFALFIGSGVVVLFSIVFLAIFFTRYRTKENREGVIPAFAQERTSYKDILQATEHFNERNLVGHGSFGSVYKGLLRDEKPIAVKVFRLESEASFKSFDTEREILHNIRHRNLIKIISSCSNKNFKALVLEYMPKGNLEKWLYSHNYCLDVMQRLNIMIDVASALEYLHHGYSTPIVHCDLKPSNVLLDEEMVGHVSDFGMGKLFDKEESNVLTSTLATLGYIAPEYGSEGLISTKCDVYSYGIMVMETFTRKRPSDDMFGGDLSLRSWVERSLIQQSSITIHQVVDVNLLKPEANQFNKTIQCVSSVLKLALDCAAEAPGDRINMKRVVIELHKIKHQFSH